MPSAGNSGLPDMLLTPPALWLQAHTRNGAKSPKELISAAWEATDNYARKKYGNNYAEIKGFSRYGAALDIYTVKK